MVRYESPLGPRSRSDRLIGAAAAIVVLYLCCLAVAVVLMGWFGN